MKKGDFWKTAKCSCKNGKYARSIDDSVVFCDEIIEEIKSLSTKSTPIKIISKVLHFTSFFITNNSIFDSY